MAVITISRQTGSLGDEIAQLAADQLGWELIDRSQLVERIFSESVSKREQHLLNESPRFFLEEMQPEVSYLDYLKQKVRSLAQEQSLILLGFGAQQIFSLDPTALHVRIIAPEDLRQERVRKQFHLDEKDALQALSQADKRHRRFVSTLYQIDSGDPSLYHIILNTGRLSAKEAAAAIIRLQAHHQKDLPLIQQAVANPTSENPDASSIFKNPSEAEFARILDMYHIDWKYEPKTFPVEWDAEGNVTLAFSPDFYLTKFDTYIELTTMNQKYVTQKNKKLRKVKELYPGTNIKIVYKRDFYSLVERFGGQFSSLPEMPSEERNTKQKKL